MKLNLLSNNGSNQLILVHSVTQDGDKVCLKNKDRIHNMNDS